eukprot:COSAG01_NODE_21882_length_881_cov_0.906650_1_plen_230_part_10
MQSALTTQRSSHSPPRGCAACGLTWGSASRSLRCRPCTRRVGSRGRAPCRPRGSLAAAVASQYFLTRTDVAQVNLSQNGRQKGRSGRLTPRASAGRGGRRRRGGGGGAGGFAPAGVGGAKGAGLDVGVPVTCPTPPAMGAQRRWRQRERGGLGRGAGRSTRAGCPPSARHGSGWHSGGGRQPAGAVAADCLLLLLPLVLLLLIMLVFFFKQKTAYEIMSGDWSSDVCSSD